VPQDKTNIILIGMPTAGKSTIGVLLAKALAMDYVDTDVLIQAREGVTLQTIIDEYGLEAFCDLEAATVCDFRPQRTVVATGGSVVYRAEAMDHLARLGTIVHLEVSLQAVQQRMTDLATRGVVLEPGQSLEELYDRRMPLYRQYAHLTVNGEAETHQEVLNRLLQVLPH
jgi:shikimate kinase